MNVLTRLKVYMGNRKILYPISLIISGINGFLSIAPYIFIWVIVKILLDNSGVISDDNVLYYAWWAVGSALASVIIYFVSLLLSHLVAFRVESNLRKMSMKKILSLPMGFFDENTTGRMRKIIDDDSVQTHTFIAHVLPDLAGSIVAPISIIILIFVFNWALGLACLIPILTAFVVMGAVMTPRLNNFQNLYLNALENMSTEAVEYVRGIPVVKVFQQSVFSFKKFYNSIIEYRDIVIKYTLGWRYPMSIYITLINGFTYFLVPSAIILISNGSDFKSSIADMFLYVLITPMIASNVMKIMYMQHAMSNAEQSVSRIENLTNSPVLSVAKDPQHITRYDISFKNVSFSYPNSNQKAVDSVSFDMNQGQTFALVGPSGGGKTTIARLIPRFWDVDEGEVMVSGVNVKDISKEELMDNVSFVFQNTKLFKTTIRENIIYGTPNASEEAINKAIDLSQSREIIDRLPKGLDTKIGVDGTYLSGGEQQRIALARAFIKDAPIVVLDEATAFADPENEALIQKAISELIKNKTVLMIAHRLTTVRNVDKILVVDSGKVIQVGTHDELIAVQGMYQTMWNEYQKSVKWTVQTK